MSIVGWFSQALGDWAFATALVRHYPGQYRKWGDHRLGRCDSRYLRGYVLFPMVRRCLDLTVNHQVAARAYVHGWEWDETIPYTAHHIQALCARRAAALVIAGKADSFGRWQLGNRWVDGVVIVNKTKDYFP